MKIKLVVLALLMVTLSYSQKHYNKSDVYGNYKMVLNISEVVKNNDSDMNLFEKILVTGITSTVDMVMEDYVEVYFDFKRNNSLKLTIKVEGEEDEIEYITWKIDNKRKIFIEDTKNDKININNDEGYWILKKNKLIKYNEDNTVVEGLSLVKVI